MKNVTAGTGLIVLSTFVAATFSVALADSTPLPATSSALAFSVLVGQWTRTQGPYVITINAVDDSGKLDAGYANPKPLPFSRQKRPEMAAQSSYSLNCALAATAGQRIRSTMMLPATV